MRGQISLDLTPAQLLDTAKVSPAKIHKKVNFAIANVYLHLGYKMLNERVNKEFAMCRGVLAETGPGKKRVVLLVGLHQLVSLTKETLNCKVNELASPFYPSTVKGLELGGLCQ